MNCITARQKHITLPRKFGAKPPSRLWLPSHSIYLHVACHTFVDGFPVRLFRHRDNTPSSFKGQGIWMNTWDSLFKIGMTIGFGTLFRVNRISLRLKSIFPLAKPKTLPILIPGYRTTLRGNLYGLINWRLRFCNQTRPPLSKVMRPICWSETLRQSIGEKK